ncbi:hypothetical protein N7461_001097 [Penicillium sp. DV-2018c]|nr:hypothetical protein N7461_001097 [Penicillium sp. DV-2018c]
MSWPEQLQENNLMTATGDEEFSNLYDFSIPFPDIEHGPGNMQHSLPTTTGPSLDMDTLRSHPMEYSGQMEGLMDFNDPTQSQSHSHSHAGHSMSYSTPSMTPSFSAQESSPMSRPSTRQHYGQGRTGIPPTPNSIEMHGNFARCPQSVDGTPDMYDQYAQINEEQALYTPLISPAMTPLENQFRLPEYTIPGEYFTPLTSPALEAQNAESRSYQHHARQVSEVGFVPTSAEMNTTLPGATAPPSPSVVRKTNNRHRPSTTASNRLNNARKVKQSPIIRAQRKRSMLASNSEEFYNSLTQELNSADSRNQELRSIQPSSNEGSGQDSVSPETLSEPLMPPPAVPPPRMSPAIAPYVPSASPGTAATPALLMRIQRNQHLQSPSGQFGGQAQLAEPELPDEVMEDIFLPEAAAPSQPRPKPKRIETAIRTPSVSASGTPSLAPSPAAYDQTPSASLAPSPRTSAMPSPSGPIPRKSEAKSASNRKRPSLSSAQPSPQLRPKISPSIQPLMKGNEGETNARSESSSYCTNYVLGMSQDALYLASKSNYQHILDGTLPSGVSYPETLAENLSSKRTNHKLAEQGRRNRINNALKEIEQLIPQDFIDARNAKEAKESSGKPGDKEKEKEKEKEKANQAISKATAVEMAIEYIKSLKSTLNATSAKLAAAEAKLSGEPSKQEIAENPPAISTSTAQPEKTETLTVTVGSETTTST